MNESIRYFTDVLDTQVFLRIFFFNLQDTWQRKKGLEEDSISGRTRKIALERLIPAILARQSATGQLVGHVLQRN